MKEEDFLKSEGIDAPRNERQNTKPQKRAGWRRQKTQRHKHAKQQRNVHSKSPPAPPTRHNSVRVDSVVDSPPTIEASQPTKLLPFFRDLKKTKKKELQRKTISGRWV